MSEDERAEQEGPLDLAEEISKDEVALKPSDTGDPAPIVEASIPEDIRERYEIYSYRNAATILSQTRRAEFDDLLKALRDFKITKKIIRTAGGNESDIPKLFSATLRPLGWHETVVQGDLLVKLTWREPTGVVKNGKKKGSPKYGAKSRDITREKYLDGHKIDYVKDRVAFDLEWNSKDQTFDRDLYAFSAFFQCGVIDAAVLVTRSKSLNPVFRALGQALKADGITPATKSSGKPRLTLEKYGASTTWMGKLLYRMNAGRNGGCPVLLVGITPKCIEDWTPADEQSIAGEPLDLPPIEEEEEED
ncbi:MAG TPA: BglII/BstYI family type II restriction endonuclease [Acidobacteriaceae bacterium]|nr:BglII/BstYI family type II restriction endonuclease [Acidobacteriaceae bacterium]